MKEVWTKFVRLSFTHGKCFLTFATKICNKKEPCCTEMGPVGCLNIKMSSSIGIPMLKIRQHCNHFIFNMGIPIHRKRVFLPRWGPGPHNHDPCSGYLVAFHLSMLKITKTNLCTLDFIQQLAEFYSYHSKPMAALHQKLTLFVNQLKCPCIILLFGYFSHGSPFITYLW